MKSLSAQGTYLNQDLDSCLGYDSGKPLKTTHCFFLNMSYEELLKRARKDLPELSEEVKRFEIPKVRGHIQGNKTIISNFHQIAQLVGRPVEHLLKYVLRELAAPGDLTESALIIGTKIPASRINEKIEQYIKDFVICPECNRPDTKLIKEDKINFIKCSVCGAKQPIRVKI